MKCPSCGRDLASFSSDSAFCPYCGQELKSEDSAELHFCPYCGQELSGRFGFCPHCGKKLVPARAKPRGYHGGLSVARRMAKSAVKAIGNQFSSQRRKRKLYQQWAEFSNLPPEEVPSMEDLKREAAAGKSKEQDPSSETD